MNTTPPIELFKERSLGERFSVAFAFMKQNGKIIVKNLAYFGIPLSLFMSFFMDRYLVNVTVHAALGTPMGSFTWPYIGAVLFAALQSIFVMGVTGAIMQFYTQGRLTATTGWRDLSSLAMPVMGKLFLQNLIVGLVYGGLMVILAIISAFFLPEMQAGSRLMIGLFAGFFLLFMLGLFALIPSLVLMSFPIIVENKGVWESIKKGFRLGFKYWGSTFVTVFLGGLLFGLAYSILLTPYMICLFAGSTMSITIPAFVTFLLMAIPSLFMLIALPVFTVLVGVQYTTVVEKEEGISMGQQIDTFDNL